MRVEFPVTHPFDYQLAMDRLAGYRAPRNKLRNLCLSGDLVRIRKGLYVAPAFPGRPPEVDPLALAPLIYGPSYVSLETALAWHGLIPERVYEITSVTSKRAKLFRTPAGRFSYRPVNEPVRVPALAGTPYAGGPMNAALGAMLDRYRPQTVADHENALREIAQELALLGLWRARLMAMWYTCRTARWASAGGA